jgi:hypothetical protein
MQILVKGGFRNMTVPRLNLSRSIALIVDVHPGATWANLPYG